MPKLVAEGFSNARLDTWKSIAEHLGRSTRTVQRWHGEYGLPVRHLGGDSTSVFAYTDELDDWLRNRNHAESPTDDAFDSIPGQHAPHASALAIHPRRPAVPNKPAGPGGRRASELIALAEGMWKSLSDANLSAIVRIYREASDVDPANAHAFAGFSQALMVGGMMGLLHTSEANRHAEAALRRALELDAGLPETRCAGAWLKLLVVRDRADAGVDFDTIMMERSECTQAMVGRALLSLAEADFSRATELLRRASMQSPLNTLATALLCWQEYLAGNFENALSFVSQARASGHAGAILNAVEALAEVLFRGPESIIDRLSPLLEDSPRHYAQLGVLGYAYGIMGQTVKAHNVIHAMTVSGIRGKCDYAYSMALTFLGLDEQEAARKWLKESYLQGSLWSLGFQFDPILKSLPHDPESWGSIDTGGTAAILA